MVAGLPLPLTDGVTALYGKIAKNLLASGDWFTLRHSQMPVVDKPPLTFWLMSLTFAALGTAAWALRLWHLALALATAAATYALARLALPRSQALLAAIILLTTAQFFYQSLVPEQHVPLALFLTLAVYWHLRWEREGAWYAPVLVSLAAALAVLTIGIAGVVMIALVIGAHLTIDRPRFPRGAPGAAMLGAAVFLSPGDKASRYLLPVFPPLAVLAGHAVGKAAWARQAAVGALAAALPLLGIVTTVAVVKFPGDAARYAPLFWSFLPPFTGALVAYAAATFLHRPKAGVVLLVLMTLLAYGLAVASMARIWDEVSPWRPIARIVNRLGSPDAHVLVLGDYNELADYYIDRPVEFVGPGDLSRAWQRERAVVVMPRDSLSTLPAPRPLLIGTAPAGLAVVSNFQPPALPPP